MCTVVVYSYYVYKLTSLFSSSKRHQQPAHRPQGLPQQRCGAQRVGPEREREPGSALGEEHRGPE